MQSLPNAFCPFICEIKFNSVCIKDGGLILVDKSITEFRNDGVYVIALDDALYVKRLQILPGKKLKVKSDNLNYDPFEVSLETDNFHIVGKVIWAGGLLECIK